MALSRLRRYSEQQQQKRLTAGLIGIIAILLFLGFFGVKLLIGFSLLIDKLRGGSSNQPAQLTQTLILAPTLNPLPEATNSASITVTGKGQAELTLILYVNELEATKLEVAKDGSFTTPSVSLKDGGNTVSAKLVDANGNLSDLSNVVRTSVKRKPPLLEIQEPSEGSTINGDKKMVTVQGKTDEDVSITINGRFVVIGNNATFQYDYPLDDGANTLSVVASDQAGNQTTIDRHVTYQR